MSGTTQLLATRLNAEPCIFRGCSSSELGFIVIAAVLFWLPVCSLFAWAIGAIAMGIGLAGIAIVLTVLIAAGLMQRMKRGRPDAYYKHVIALKLDRLGLRRSTYICREGHWSLGRTQGLRAR